MQQSIGRFEVLINKNKNEVLITQFVKKKRGTLEAWFSHGRLFRYTKEEIRQSGWDIINKILNEPQNDYVADKSEFDMMSDSKCRQYSQISIGIYPDEIWITPLELTSKDSGAIGKDHIKMRFPIDNSLFATLLGKVTGNAE